MKKISLYMVGLTITSIAIIIINTVLHGEVKYPRFDRHSSSSSQDLSVKKLQKKDNQGQSMNSQGHVQETSTTDQEDGNSLWKQMEIKNLSNLIQKRLHFLQNPPDCKKARKVVCKFAVTAGFGNQMHHLSFCLIMAYGSQRTLILESKGVDFEKFFLPLSENCVDRKGSTTAKWGTPEENENFQVLELPMLMKFPANLKPNFMPMAIPEDIAERLRRVHSKPQVWWIGEIMTYILRPQSHVQEFIDNRMAALGFTHPVVGIHVRRTDKLIKEAKFHGIEEYMNHANRFYEEFEKKKGKASQKRKIFIATDDPDLLEEAKERYPGYVFLSDNKISQSANVSTRYLDDSIKGTITDVQLLSHSDFLVCTFSSNLGRLAYEMMQHYHADASTKAHSLDKQYFWTGQKFKGSGKTAKMPTYEEAENVHL